MELNALFSSRFLPSFSSQPGKGVEWGHTGRASAEWPSLCRRSLWSAFHQTLGRAAATGGGAAVGVVVGAVQAVAQAAVWAQAAAAAVAAAVAAAAAAAEHSGRRRSWSRPEETHYR